MNSKHFAVVILASVAWLAPLATAQSSAHSIDELAFIAGSWQGPLFDGDADETWMPARDGTMIGRIDPLTR